MASVGHVTETGGSMAVSSLATRWDIRLRTLPWWVFFVLVVIIGLLKTGVSVIRSAPEPLASFPVPQPTASALSYGSRTAAKVLGWEFPDSYVLITTVVTVMAVVVLGFILRPGRLGVDGRLLALVIVLGPIGQVLFTHIGGHDAWVLLGGLVLGLLGARIWWSLAGAILMVLGNPEQALLATACLLALTWTPWMRARRVSSLAAFASAFLLFLVLSGYAFVSGVPNRSGYLTMYLGSSLYNFGANLPLSFYAALGIVWVVLVWALMRVTWSSRVILVASLVLVPLLFTAITMDQTRVFVGISCAAVAAFLIEAVPRMRVEAEDRGFRNTVFWTGLAAIFLPTVVVTFTGTVIVPHAWFFTWVVPHLKSALGGFV